MNVEELMTSTVEACCEGDMLNRAAQIMWDHDCGAVPVVDPEGKPIAMITDRDICMAGYTQGLPQSQIRVSAAMSKKIVTCRKGESLAEAESIMRSQQIRRLPIVDDEGRILGILSLHDIATHAHLKKKGGFLSDELGSEAIAKTLSAICTRKPLDQAAQ